MSGYYPAGVTGNEYQIAGGHEFDTVRPSFCDNEECKMYGVEDVEAEVEVELAHGTEYYSWTCPTCGVSRDIERNTDWD
jgi:predicted RNA-binding Zn-ribbon protein involved in translation (DUF1610 family)